METEAQAAQPLHEFMAANRDQILEMAVRKAKERAPTSSDVDVAEGLPEVFDEIVKALRRASGLADPAPDFQQAGSRVGDSRKRQKKNIGLVAFGIGAISDSVGALGAQHNLVFHSREYQVFNQSLDESVAGAIEEFARQERAELRFEESKRTGFIAHELRNALSTARLAYTTLKKGAAGINSHTGDLLGRGLIAVENLVRQMMAAVQLESGSPVERRSVAVADVFKNLDEATMTARGVVIRWEAEPDLSVTADERLLNTSLMNLLQNGLKFTRNGGTVIVRARREHSWLVFEVQDECGGLPPGKEATIFHPFVQEGDDRSGLGLGLAITREATEAQGGRVLVHNLPGRGCIFSVELPAP